MAAVMFDPWWTQRSLGKTIPAYPYVQYNDDDNVVAFFMAHNQLAQAYVTWFQNINLPVYSQPQINGPLLDWVAEGVYGLTRPYLPVGIGKSYGAYNTAYFNQRLAYNQRRSVGPANYYQTDDDTFKRCMTWNLYRGDGTRPSVRWLKRRVARFLAGANGTDYGTAATYQISVTFGTGNQININLVNQTTRLAAGALLNTFAFNKLGYNKAQVSTTQLQAVQNAATLKAAIQAGALQLPFQYTWVVNVSAGVSNNQFTNNQGQLRVSAAANYPTTPIGLLPGAVWSQLGAVQVVPGGVNNPLQPLMSYPSTLPATLLAVGGASLPTQAGVPGSGLLWVDSSQQVRVS